MKALIVAGQGVQDIEFAYPFYRLQEDGVFEVHVAVRGKQPCTGIVGLKIQPTHDIPELVCSDYDLLIIPGGVKAMEHMRLDKELIAFIAQYHAENGHAPIGSICSGAQLLISAGLVKGRKISGYYAMQIDIENAGGTFVDAPVVYHDKIFTSPHYKYIGQWMGAVINEADNDNS